MIGKGMSGVLVELEEALWEFEESISEPPKFTEEGFRAASKIFFAAIMDKMWVLQQNENTPMADREKMATKAGEDFSNLIKIYTNIDTKKLYK